MENGIEFFIAFGFIAQLIDGALGMGYGVSSTTLLLSFGVAPAAASASVHAAECFTTAISGWSHWKFGNVDWKLVRKLAVPGVIGAMTGAYILTELPGDKIKPFIAIYLAVMGMMILKKAFRQMGEHKENLKHIGALGLVGGASDAIGGGGWGPIVTSTLVARGNHPRFTVGSVNLVEFLVTFSQSVVFLMTIGLTHWKVILGLLLGGIVAAPLAALFAKRVKVKVLMVMVGVLIIILSMRTIYMAWLK